MESGTSGLSALRGLHRVLARVTGVRDLDATLQAVVDGVVEAVGFDVAAVNCVRADGSFEVRAVAGPEEARAALMGAVSPPDTFEREFALADHWGSLRFVPHERLQGPVAGWVPSCPATGGWHPEDALFAPLYAASGELVGVLSVDLPHDGRRPGPLQRELLEMFAAQAGIAIDNARLSAQLRRDHERLQASEESLSLAFDGSDVGMAMIQLEPPDAGRVLRANPALARLTGYSAEELTRMRVADLSHPQDLAASRDGLSDALRQALDEGSEGYRMEKRYVRSDGRVIWLSISNRIIRDAEGGALYGFVQAQDVTERRATEQVLVQAATRDPLTGLLNRTALLQHLANAVVADRIRRPGAVVFCDLDGFKAVNDSRGHDAGDTVLVTVARRLQAAVRDGDAVARLGGDEFVLVVHDIDEPGLEDLAHRLLKEVAQPIHHQGRRLKVTASLGLTMLDGGLLDPATILRQADQAMYQAKKAGRNRHAFHAA